MRVNENIKRLIDIVFSLVFIIFLASFWLLIIIRLLHKKSIIKQTKKVGKNGSIFSISIFRKIKTKWLKRSLTLINIFKGEMSFVGPRPISYHEFLQENPSFNHPRFSVSPGIFGLWQLRKAASIHYDSEFDVDAEYVHKLSLKKDSGILLRSFLTLIGKQKSKSYPNELDILGLRVHNKDMKNALQSLQEMMNSKQKYHVGYLNADYANIAYKNKQYAQVVDKIDLVLPDGLGIRIACKWMKTPLKQNVPTTDLFPKLCKEISNTSKTLFLLGGKPGVTDRLIQWIDTHYPKVNIIGHHHGYFERDEESKIIEQISNIKPDMLIVSMGAPQQDIWIHNNLEKLDVKVAMSAGGCFDYYAGNVPRAPIWMREIGMEWVFRLIQEPKRLWKRYLVGNGVFLWRAFRYKMNSKFIDNK